MKPIKEPKGVELIVDSGPLSEEEKSLISQIIQFYKKTGSKLVNSKSISLHLKRKSKRNQVHTSD